MTVARDDKFNFIAAHWTDLYSILYNALPSEIILWGHQFLSFRISHDKSTVTIKARVAKTGEIVEITSDLLVAADGCLSSIRRNFLPDFKLRSVIKFESMTSVVSILFSKAIYCAAFNIAGMLATLHGEGYSIFQVKKVQKP